MGWEDGVGDGAVGEYPEDVSVGAVSGVGLLELDCVVAALLDGVLGVFALTLGCDDALRVESGDVLKDDVLLVWISALTPMPPPTKIKKVPPKITSRLCSNTGKLAKTLFTVFIAFAVRFRFMRLVLLLTLLHCRIPIIIICVLKRPGACISVLYVVISLINTRDILSKTSSLCGLYVFIMHMVVNCFTYCNYQYRAYNKPRRDV